MRTPIKISSIVSRGWPDVFDISLVEEEGLRFE